MLVALAVAHLLGTVLSGQAGFHPGPWPALAGLLVAAAITMSRKPPNGVAAVAALLVSGFLAGAAASPPTRMAPREARGVFRIVGKVLDPGPPMLLRVGEARVIDGEPEGVGRGTILRIHDAEGPRGSSVAALVQVRPLRGFRNPSPHPRWRLIAQATMEGRLEPGTRPVVLARNGWMETLDRVRARASDAVGRSLEPRTAGLVRTLVLGVSGSMDPDDERAVRDAGLAHVLAVSGLHVTVLAGTFVWGLRRLLACVPLARRVDPARPAAAVGIAFALLYAGVASSAPSAWRAAVTAAMAWTFVALGRRPDPVRTTALAVLLLGSISPEQVLRPGFLLSVAATAAVLGAPPIGPRIGDVLRAGLVTSARAWIATAPLVLWCFGSAPLVAVVASVVVVPLGNVLLLPVAALHVALVTLHPDLGVATAWLVELGAHALMAAASAFADIGLGHDLPPPSVAQGLAIAAGCCALLLLRTWKARLVAAAITALLVAIGEWRLRRTERPTGRVRVTFLDVGQGDAALVDLPDGSLLVVDTGGPPGVDTGARVLEPILRARRRSRIDVLAISHPHPDHDGGVRTLLSRFAVGELWHSGRLPDEPGPPAPLTPLVGRTLHVRAPPQLCGRSRSFGPAQLEVLAPCPRADPLRSLNDDSLVLRVRFGRRAFLFPGDVEVDGERSLLRTAAHALRADVLKVPHHGSRTSSSAAWLATVRPTLAVISAGRANRHGHPHPEVLRRLREAGADVLQTALHGGIVVTTDGDRLEAITWSGLRWSDAGG
ncbi:MAG: DNA internalization-related competence protein ComEC/Rec2 [Myxococcota bacterium]|nr:DNA internalization-related competence protein ComEC/Rec2 [Myxococcota bacterium]MDW8361480.1 DNA internalization-related competence protein ComEC/Rec2 [Myxococcales bacterium]